jgi:hypothetical protein
MTIPLDTPRPFTTAEGLRLLLVRLHYAGPAGWSSDPEAADLMSYTMDKYGALAHKHGYQPGEAAVAAFDAMRTRAVRVADDPWAVVTHAVELTLIYERRAEGLLCSTHQARRDPHVARHDAERFSDHASDLAEFHPAFAIQAPQDALHLDADHDDRDHDDEDEDGPTNALVAIDEAVAVFAALRWPEDVARTAIEYVCARLIRSGTRETAFESLRRDRHAQALLDIDQRAWLMFLRLLLGNQHRDRRHTVSGRGMLLRLVLGEEVEDLLEDRALVAEIATIRHPHHHSARAGAGAAAGAVRVGHG